jgi:hypothetical protein
VANGKVYLASFGTANVGSGQFCVYGLLPEGAPPMAPAEVTAAAKDGRVSLAWQATGGFTTYRVASSAGPSGPFETLVVGLTTPSFTGIPAPEGATYYTVTAVSSDGVGPASAPAKAVVAKPEAMDRKMAMH